MKRVMYLEQKTGIGAGTAVIAEVSFNRTRKTLYYDGPTFGKVSFQRLKKGGIYGNHYCRQLNAEFWISGLKKRGSNQHPAEVHQHKVIDERPKEEGGLAK